MQHSKTSAALIPNVDQLALPHFAMRRNPSSDCDFPGFHIIRPRFGAFLGGRKFVGKRVNPLRAETREFGLALFDE